MNTENNWGLQGTVWRGHASVAFRHTKVPIYQDDGIEFYSMNKIGSGFTEGWNWNLCQFRFVLYKDKTLSPLWNTALIESAIRNRTKSFSMGPCKYVYGVTSKKSKTALQGVQKYNLIFVKLLGYLIRMALFFRHEVRRVYRFGLFITTV